MHANPGLQSSLTSSFSVTDANNEVVCPLKNNDGSNCRKRCLGEKRYRSMQEHIRRAHPNHYIPKLPATEESFLLMVNTPPEQRTQLSPPEPAPPRRRHGHHGHGHGHGQFQDVADRDIYVADASSPATPRALDEPHPAAATAAVALAQLHHHRLASDWDTDMDTHSDTELHPGPMRSSIELPSLRDHFKQESLPPFTAPRPRELLPSILNHSPPWSLIHASSNSAKRQVFPVAQNLDLTIGTKTQARTTSVEGIPSATKSQPQTAAWAQGKRWEDLIEAATSATEADDERYSEAGRSPTIAPLLANSLTPPPFEGHRGRDSDLEPFPSIESSLDSMSTASGKNFPSSASGPAHSVNSDSSPVLNLIPPVSQRQHHRFSNPTPASFRSKEIQIYCAQCKRPWALNECFACTNCICGVCRECVGMFITSPPTSFRSPGNGPLNNMPPGPTSYPTPSAARGCPRCRTVGGQWKAFQLDIK
ncbi:hypothetical protein N7481_003051 [Penicillium waksmanii]|uniref:uncharacterized protein n=1 Tax=Penicillium waksmanii TaxID=69791 RepID=UPI002547208B|nr:uncharacterized protein N7481_003051 [Penicillium waksmanii]KAJ5987841.1 hypothetical protein N7481_003051 [Penicillium waksmanii]